jgi:hypothetical protein
VKETADNFLSVRDAPKPSGVELGRLPSGSIVEIHAEKGIWRRIASNEERWVSSLFLESVDPADRQDGLSSRTGRTQPDVPSGDPVGDFIRPKAGAWKKNAGGSDTTGLQGHVLRPDEDTEVVVATEELTAKRENKSFGPRTVRQVRTTNLKTGQTTISQADYCWGDRSLPDAVIFTDHPGFEEADGVEKGEASYFGKYDPTDEGTGSPLFGIVQTNSSIFAVSLPKPLLIKYGIARQQGNSLVKTAKSHTAMVEIYYPAKRRLLRAPIVDVGPKEGLNRPADLSVAAAAFLQDKPEQSAKGYKLANLQVELRIV